MSILFFSYRILLQNQKKWIRFLRIHFRHVFLSVCPCRCQVGVSLWSQHNHASYGWSVCNIMLNRIIPISPSVWTHAGETNQWLETSLTIMKTCPVATKLQKCCRHYRSVNHVGRYSCGWRRIGDGYGVDSRHV